jgi:hypothetical protein
MIAAEEQLLPGPAAIERVTGERPHYSTFFRWTQRGVLVANGRRIRLPFVKAGSKRLTTVAAVRRFFGDITEAASAPSLCLSSTGKPIHSDDDNELVKLGL